MIDIFTFPVAKRVNNAVPVKTYAKTYSYMHVDLEFGTVPGEIRLMVFRLNREYAPIGLRTSLSDGTFTRPSE